MEWIGGILFYILLFVCAFGCGWFAKAERNEIKAGRAAIEAERLFERVKNGKANAADLLRTTMKTYEVD